MRTSKAGPAAFGDMTENQEEIQSRAGKPTLHVSVLCRLPLNCILTCDVDHQLWDKETLLSQMCVHDQSGSLAPWVWELCSHGWEDCFGMGAL